MSVRVSLLSMAPLAAGEILALADDETRTLVLSVAGPLGLLVRHAETEEAAAAIAEDRAACLDCVVLDATYAGADPRGLIRRLRASPVTATVPKLMLLGAPPTDADLLSLLELGVLDHATKPLAPELFSARLKAVCDRSRMQRDLKNKLDAALENAATDSLTGLFNRRYFERRLREESAHAKRHERPFSVLMLDLDHFKNVNDTFGHEDGDRVLVHVAETIGETLREDDIACRYGGEEMVLILRATARGDATIVASRLREALANKPILLGPSREPRCITFSAGIASADGQNAFDATDIVGRADQAMYAAKRAGRDRAHLEE